MQKNKKNEIIIPALQLAILFVMSIMILQENDVMSKLGIVVALWWTLVIK